MGRDQQYVVLGCPQRLYGFVSDGPCQIGKTIPMPFDLFWRVGVGLGACPHEFRQSRVKRPAVDFRSDR